MTFRTFSRTLALHRGSLRALLALAVLMTAFGTAIDRPREVRAATFRHLALRSSVPAADATVGRTLDEVRLFFTEAPQIDATLDPHRRRDERARRLNRGSRRRGGPFAGVHPS